MLGQPAPPFFRLFSCGSCTLSGYKDNNMQEEETTDTERESTSKIRHIAGWRYLAFWPLSVILRLWGATLRFKITPENLRLISKSDIPAVVIIWHNWLFVASEIIRRYRYHHNRYGKRKHIEDPTHCGVALCGVLAFECYTTSMGCHAAL